MASIVYYLSTLLFAFLLFPNRTFSVESPELSPSPSQHISPEAISLPPQSPSPSPALPDSPPSSPPPDLALNSPSPAPSPAEDDGDATDHKTPPTPSPAPDVAADISQEDRMSNGDLEKKDGYGGMDGGQKAGVAIGVIAAACVVGLGAVVYKKRQQNIRRSQYGYAARREFL